MKQAGLKSCGAVLLSALLIGQLSACSGTDAPSVGGGSSSADSASSSLNAAPDHDNIDMSGEYPKCKEPVTIRIGLTQDPLVTDYEDNKFTKFLEETCNVNIEFDLYPAADAESKIRILIASDSDMPDIFGKNNLSSLDVYNYGLEGAIIPLNDYIAAYGTYYRDMLANDESYEKIMTMPDKNIYAFPKVAENLPNQYSQRAWINKKWLDAVGLGVPTTTDEMYEALKAFVTKDPNGNGKADEIGVAGSTDGWRQQPYNWFMNAFEYDCYVSDSILRMNVAEDGKTIYTPIVTDGWRAGLSYMNKLCEEGLYSPQSFTQDSQQFQAICNTEEGSLVGLATTGVLTVTGDDYTDYVPVGPLTGPDGVCNSAFFAVDISPTMIITSTCKNPAAAFILCDTMMSPEASLRSRFGEPGVDCELVTDDGSKTAMLEGMGKKPYLIPKLDWSATTNNMWRTNHACYYFADMMNGQVWDGNPRNSEYILSQAIPLYAGKEPAKVVNTLVYDQEEVDIVRDPTNTINTYVKESIAQFITGVLDVDDAAVWQSYLDELKNMQLDKVMETNQKVYDRMYNS